jgi:glycosyltransferase involved in cell wall biosynthesis
MANPHHVETPAVVFALPDLNGGGAEKVVINIVRNWSATDVAPVILLSRRRGRYVRHVPEHVPVVTLDVSLRARDIIRFGRRVRDELAEFNVRTVVSSMTAMNRMILRARLFHYLTCRVVVVEQTNLSVRLQRERLRWLRAQELKLLYATADNMIGASHGLAEDVASTLSLPRDRMECVHNPIDVEQVHQLAYADNSEPLAQDVEALKRPIICAAGRLTPQKGFDDLIRAFARLAPELRGTLIILGEGDRQRQLRELADSLGIGSCVYLAGFSDNPWWYIARSQALALSSRWEGFGNVVVEAMACNTPVVATDCPHGPGEIVRHGVDGLLVTPGDVPGLTEALSRLLEDDRVSAAMAANGRVRAREFDAATTSRRYAAL